MVDFVYLTGTSHSGSTLFSFILNAHPEIVSVGPLHGVITRVTHPEAYQCSCGATLVECAFWAQVGARMHARGFTFDPARWHTRFELEGPGALTKVLVRSLRSNAADRARDAAVSRAPRWGKELAAIGARNSALASCVREVTGKAVLVDTSKEPRRPTLLMRYAGVEPLVVHLVRDAPGYVSSKLKRDRGSVEQAVRQWLSVTRSVERLKRTFPPQRWLTVRYEDLVTDPRAEVARIARSVGVTPDPPSVDFRQAEHHILGNAMRKSSRSDISLDQSWRDRLSKDQVRTILEDTQPYRKQFGYALNP